MAATHPARGQGRSPPTPRRRRLAAVMTAQGFTSVAPQAGAGRTGGGGDAATSRDRRQDAVRVGPQTQLRAHQTRPARCHARCTHHIRRCRSLTALAAHIAHSSHLPGDGREVACRTQLAKTSARHHHREAMIGRIRGVAPGCRGYVSHERRAAWAAAAGLRRAGKGGPAMRVLLTTRAYAGFRTRPIAGSATVGHHRPERNPITVAAPPVGALLRTCAALRGSSHHNARRSPPALPDGSPCDASLPSTAAPASSRPRSAHGSPSWHPTCSRSPAPARRWPRRSSPGSTTGYYASRWRSPSSATSPDRSLQRRRRGPPPPQPSRRPAMAYACQATIQRRERGKCRGDGRPAEGRLQRAALSPCLFSPYGASPPRWPGLGRRRRSRRAMIPAQRLSVRSEPFRCMVGLPTMRELSALKGYGNC